MFRQLAWGLTAVAVSIAVQACPAAAVERVRVALVIGNAAYEKGPLQSALNDAGLVAEALNSAGFEVLAGADVNQAELRLAFRDFIAMVEAGGPDVDAFVYFAGYGLEFDGENYLLPIGVRLKQIGDIPIEAVRLADLVRRLSGIATGAKVVALDVARALPFPLEGERIAPGLASLDPQPGLLLATSSEPGTIAPDSHGHYGPYAMAIAEMVRDPTRQFDSIFKMIRKRTFRTTEGRQLPWHVSALTDENDLASVGVPRPPNIRDMASPPQPAAGESSADAALALAIEADSLSRYVHYVETYPRGPFAARIHAAIRTRREALTWLRATELNTAEGYWTYLLRYTDGVHAGGAARRLQRISAKTWPQPGFTPVDFFDVLPPSAGESLEFTIPPAQPVPDALIGPPPLLFVDLSPPSSPVQLGRLPSPGPLPLTLSSRQRPQLRSISRILSYEGAVATAAAPMVSASDHLLPQIAGSTSPPPKQAQVGRDAPSQSATLNQEPLALPPPPVSVQPQQSSPPMAVGPPLTVPIPRVRPRGSSVAIAAIASPRRAIPAPHVPPATTSAPAAGLLPFWPFGSTLKKSTPIEAARIRP